MIPSLERGCQLRWYRPCGDEFPIWSGWRYPGGFEDPSVILVMDAGIQTGSGWLVIAWG